MTQAVANAKKGADLRVFTLGIGETTSTAICEGIARAGNGVCLMAATSETIIGKCSKLVKASGAEILKNVSVDWGIPKQLVVPKDNVDAQNAPFRQGPSKLSSLYAGNRFVVFAIAKHERFEMPREVVICAHRTSGEKLRFAIAVEEVPSTTDRGEPHWPLIHTLAARRIITALEDGRQGFIPSHTRVAIVHLGEQYQLVSQHTSFVAVEERSHQPLLSPGDEHVVFPHQAYRKPQVRTGEAPSFGMSHWPALRQTRGPIPTRAVRERELELERERERAREREKVYAVLPPATFQGMDITIQHPAHETLPKKRRTTADYTVQPHGAAESPVVHISSSVTATTPNVALGTPRSAEDQVVQLVRLQSFDGAFPASTMLAQIIGNKALDEGRELGVDAVLWATVLAVAYLQKYMAKQPELLEGLLEKATEFVQQQPGVDLADLLAKAQVLIA